MDPSVVKIVKVTPAFAHPCEGDKDFKVAYTSAQPAVTAMSRTTATLERLGIDPTKMEVDEELKSYDLQFTSEDYIRQFKEDHEYQAMKTLQLKANAEEQMLRKFYAKKAALAGNRILDEKFPLLVPAFGNEDIFKCTALSCVEKEIPKVFALENKRKKAGVMSICDRNGFETNWRIFSERLLDLVNWNNLFVAGGSILACLLPPPPKALKNFKCLRKYFHEDAYAGSDIDLYVYGLNEKEGIEKLKEVYEAVCNEIPYSVLAFRSAYAISIVSQFPYRHIQIILRLYASPAEILMGFDVDSCSCGYDGKQVYMTPRCHQALVRQMNTIDITRRSPTYEMRLAKYADRGFEVEVPSLIRDHVDPMIFEKPWDEVRGLPKLLLLEKLRTPEARYAYKERSSNSRFNGSYKMQNLMNDPYLKKRLEFSSEKASDYSTVFLPWGPDWNAKRIRKLMTTKDIVLNSEWSEQFTERGYHTHPCFIGTLEDVIKDCCGECPEIPVSVDPETLECFVSGPLSFIVDDPGRQTIGSFHPITDGDWSDGTYLSKDYQKFTVAANCGDVMTIRAMVEEGTKVDTPDSLGRTALHIAVLSNQVEAVKVLLELGADPTLHLRDGRSVVHVSAQYGYLEMLAVLLEKLKITKISHTVEAEGEVSSGDVLDIDEVNASNQMAAVHYAVLFGHVDCAEFLLKNGATCDKMIWTADKTMAISVMILAAHCECFNPQVATDLYDLLFSYGASLKLVDNILNNVMHHLCSFNYAHFIQYVLEKDPIALKLCEELNWNAQTPLMIAVSNGYYNIAKLLIDHEVPIKVSESSLMAMNNKRKKSQSGNRYGFYETQYDQIQPLMVIVMNSVKSDGMINFCQYLIEKGYDINTIYQNSTVLNLVLNTNPFMSEEEYKEQRAANTFVIERQIEMLEKELLQYDEGSYAYDVLQRYLKDQKKNMKKQMEGQPCEMQTFKADKEYNEKLYNLFDKNGGMMYGEIIEINGPSAQPKTSTHRKGGLFSTSAFGSTNCFGCNSSTVECCTVVKGKALHGQDRIKAIRESEKKKRSEQISAMIASGQAVIENVPGINQFMVYSEASQYCWRNNTNVINENSTKYLDLFEAIHNNDKETIRDLCTADSKGHCVFLLCSGADGMSPLAYAINLGNKEIIELLFILLEKQYTPITKVKEVKKTSRVSNYALVNGDEEEESVFVDPNSDATLIVNTCDVNVIFTESVLFDMSKSPSYVTYAVNDGNAMSGFCVNGSGDEIANEKEQLCTIFEYLVYHSDVNLMEFCLNLLRDLSDKVYAKNEKANIITPKQTRRETSLLCSIFTATFVNSGYGRGGTNVNILTPAIMNDNVEMIQLIMQYNLGGLFVLTEEDVKPKEVKKCIKHDLNQGRHYDDSDEDCEEDSYSSDDEIIEEKMEVEEEDDVELNEEGKEEEEEDKESVESEYADSDEEEMKKLKRFRQEGKTEEKGRVSNSLYPILVCVRYNSQKALQYFTNAVMVKHDLTCLERNNSVIFEEIKAAGGIDAVFDRVFTMKYHQKEARLLVETAAMNNNVEIFKIMMIYLVSCGFDDNIIVKGSKNYCSILEFVAVRHYLDLVEYLIGTYSFRDKEIVKAYYCLMQSITSISIQLEVSRNRCGGKAPRKMGMRKCNVGIDPMDPVHLYKKLMELVLLIPSKLKEEVFNSVMPLFVNSQKSLLTREVLKRSEIKLGDVDDLVESVTKMQDYEMMKVLVECFGLRDRLMKENPHGYTVVECVMNAYVSAALENKNMRTLKRDDTDEIDEKTRMKEEKIAAESDEMRAKVDMLRINRVDEASLANMLEYVLKESNGLKRELTTSEEVQKRVKKDSDAAVNSSGSFGRRSVRMSSIKEDSMNIYLNSRSTVVAQLGMAEEKNI